MSNGLPTWDEMSDVDKGATLLHLWKRRREGAAYAVENYPVKYLDHPALVALGDEDACKHAQKVTGGDSAISQRIGREEYVRLYELALDAER